MTAREPAEIAVVAVETGMKKATRSAPHVLVGGFLAGAYIAFGGLVAIAVSSGLDPRRGARCRRCSPAPSSRSA